MLGIAHHKFSYDLGLPDLDLEDWKLLSAGFEVLFGKSKSGRISIVSPTVFFKQPNRRNVLNSYNYKISFSN